MSKQNTQWDDMAPQVHEALRQLLEHISRRDQKILWLNGEKAEAARSFFEKEQALSAKISEKDAVLLYTQTQLSDREAQLNEILTSRTWKIALLIQRIRVFLVPPESRRAEVLRRGLNIILFPFQKIKRN